MKKKIQPITILKIIAILMLFGALAHNPYAYYQILRWVTAAIAGYAAYIAHEHRKTAWAWILAITAVLYNPIAPIYLDRETWAIIDLIVAVVIFISIFKAQGTIEKRSS